MLLARERAVKELWCTPQVMFLKYQLPSEPSVYVDLLDDEDVSLMFDEVRSMPVHSMPVRSCLCNAVATRGTCQERLLLHTWPSCLCNTVATPGTCQERLLLHTWPFRKSTTALLFPAL